MNTFIEWRNLFSEREELLAVKLVKSWEYFRSVQNIWTKSGFSSRTAHFPLSFVREFPAQTKLIFLHAFPTQYTKRRMNYFFL